MADFRYVKCLYGESPETINITLAGTVEEGDLIAVDCTKADDGDAAVAYLAEMGGDSADVIPVIPLLPGVVIEGEVDGALAQTATGAGIAIETATQVIDVTGASNPLFTVVMAADADGDKAWVTVKAGVWG